MMISTFKEAYKKHERWVPIIAFLSGFVFDVVMLRRIDELKIIIQQAVYLIIAAVLIAVDLIEEGREVATPKALAKVWKYREAILHFLLGTLLNSYAIFYFKSASAITSFVFIGLLVALLTLNEFKRFGKSQSQVHVAFLSLCLISYFVCLAPTVLGFIGTIPFLVATTTSSIIFYFFYVFMRNKVSESPSLLKTHLVFPFALIQILFVVLYFAHLIPPVPLSVKYMGIYHGIEKKDGGYELTYTRPEWKFWQHGDQTFEARPGDVVYCYTQVFSPTHFSDQLQVRWLSYDEKEGWVSLDTIPMPVVGGREEGFRGLTKKTKFQPGLWRVQVETADSQEIGRINFKVVPDETTGERELHLESR